MTKAAVHIFRHAALTTSWASCLAGAYNILARHGDRAGEPTSTCAFPICIALARARMAAKCTALDELWRKSKARITKGCSGVTTASYLGNKSTDAASIITSLCSGSFYRQGSRLCSAPLGMAAARLRWFLVPCCSNLLLFACWPVMHTVIRS
jgi:hypothetical protein